MTGSVFISYRREDSSGYARAIYNELRGQLGPESIFMDVDAIEPGLDFVKVIEGAVERCDVLLALIGPRWLDAGGETGPRLQSQSDYVRTEIATALARDVRVIPILVGGAVMPSPDNLPDDIVPLTRRNAIEIRHTHFDADVASLIDVLVKLVNPTQEKIPPSSPAAKATKTSVAEAAVGDTGRRKRRWVGPVVTLLIFIFLGFLFFLFVTDLYLRSGSSTVSDDNALITSSATAVLALLITVVAAWSGRRRWWLGMVVGLLAFAALGAGVAIWLNDGLRASWDGSLIGAIAVWVVGFLVIVGKALWQRKKMKNHQIGEI